MEQLAAPSRLRWKEYNPSKSRVSLELVKRLRSDHSAYPFSGPLHVILDLDDLRTPGNPVCRYEAAEFNEAARHAGWRGSYLIAISEDGAIQVRDLPYEHGPDEIAETVRGAGPDSLRIALAVVCTMETDTALNSGHSDGCSRFPFEQAGTRLLDELEACHG